VSEKVAPVLKFTELQERYVVENEKGGTWTEKTKAEYLLGFALFERVMGDMPINQIDRTLMSDYKSILMQLPPNLNKMPQYNGLTTQEIIATKSEITIAVDTLNKNLRRLAAMFSFGVKHGFMTANPAEGMQVKKPKRADQERDDYAKEDLQILFRTKEYREGSPKHSYGFWTPLIGLYTGCRLEEICQLHLEDIWQENGV